MVFEDPFVARCMLHHRFAIRFTGWGVNSMSFATVAEDSTRLPGSPLLDFLEEKANVYNIVLPTQEQVFQPVLA